MQRPIRKAVFPVAGLGTRFLRCTYSKKPVLDIGCGRDELLAAFKHANLNAIGIDMDGYNLVKILSHASPSHDVGTGSH